MSKKLLIVTAAIEAGTGFGLLFAPSLIAQLLLGEALETPAAVTIARVAGAALLAIGIACWLSREDGRALVLALLFYNLIVAAVLAHAAVALAVSGVGLWPTVGLHAAFVGWCAVAFKSAPLQTIRKPML